MASLSDATKIISCLSPVKSAPPDEAVAPARKSLPKLKLLNVPKEEEQFML